MDTSQQIIAKIGGSQNILVIGNGINGDSLAASLAVRSFLKKLEKDVTLLVPTSLTDRFHFLPGMDDVTHEVDLTKSFVIDLSTQRTQVAELSYKKETDRLSIYIKPKDGEFAATDVSFRSSAFPYDVLILIGIPSLEQLGEFYSRHAELFFDVPVVNIDFRGSNENYGQFNLVQLHATSVSEIVLDLVNKFEASLIDENIATQLLAGIISETNSFQHVRTTPQTFLKASQLVSLGAKQQEIISHLYKTKSLGLLKLWGRVLARLKQETDIHLAYSAINLSDIEKSGAGAIDIDAIIKEMVANLGFAKIFMFIKEDNQSTSTAYVHSNLPINLLSLFNQFQPQAISPQSVKLTVPQSITNSESRLIETLRTELSKIKPTG